MKTYNGHRSWNAWNVSLWISNYEPLYRFALDCIAEARKSRSRHILSGATRRFMRDMRGTKTPDGALYNALSVKLCLQGLMED